MRPSYSNPMRLFQWKNVEEPHRGQDLIIELWWRRRFPWQSRQIFVQKNDCCSRILATLKLRFTVMFTKA